MRYASVIDCSISDGPGFRVSLFTQGCSHHCPGCFNKCTWDFNGGKKFTSETACTIINKVNKSYCTGLSILGGEPLSPTNLSDLYYFLHQYRLLCDKPVWLWTGYHFEDLSVDQMQLLDLVDVVISEPFILERKVRDLKYAGSDNQRLWIKDNGVWVEKNIE